MGLSVAVIVALYTIHGVRHLPSRGQSAGCLQLHVRGVVLALVDSTLALWAVMIDPMLGIQL